jgi:hypothetical protein
MSHSAERSNVEPSGRIVYEGGGSLTNLALSNERIDELWKVCLESRSPDALREYYKNVRTLRRELGIGDPNQGDAYVPRERKLHGADSRPHETSGEKSFTTSSGR